MRSWLASSRKGSQSQAGRAAATNAAPCAVVSRRRSAEGASATASAFVSASAGQSPASTARKAAANKMASARGAPKVMRSTSQPPSDRASKMTFSSRSRVGAAVLPGQRVIAAAEPPGAASRLSRFLSSWLATAPSACRSAVVIDLSPTGFGPPGHDPIPYITHHCRCRPGRSRQELKAKNQEVHGAVEPGAIAG